MAQSISITRALVELKRFDQRINSEVSSGVFAAVKVGTTESARVASSGNVRHNSADLALSRINGSLQSVNALIKNRAAMKAAIIKSNAATQIEFMGTKISVAEAIEMKASKTYLQHLARYISAHLVWARNEVSQADAKLEVSINSLAQAAVGSTNKVDAVTLSTITTAQNAISKATIVGEDLAEKHLKEVNDRISAIEAELDFTLSESNARTMIEVEL